MRQLFTISILLTIALLETSLFADSPSDNSAADNWLAMGQELAKADAAASKAPSASTKPASAPAADLAAGQRYVPWRNRYGPAYPGEFWTSFGRDGKEFLPIMWDNTKATVTNPLSLVCIGLAGASGIAINASGADDKVADHYERHGSQLNTFWDSVGDAGGNPGTHFAIAGAAYLATLAANDVGNYEKSKTMLHALALNGIVTEALKVAARTHSPNGDPLGWPSGHMSSSVCFATVLHEQYGPMVGVPAFAFAGYVGYERIDARNHDFSDVVSGAFLGLAIGHAVAQNSQARIAGMKLVPYVDPRGVAGVALVKDW